MRVQGDQARRYFSGQQHVAPPEIMDDKLHCVRILETGTPTGWDKEHRPIPLPILGNSSVCFAPARISKCEKVSTCDV